MARQPSKRLIDRGLSYVCGGDVYGGEHECGLVFCGQHRFPALCYKCTHDQQPCTPKEGMVLSPIPVIPLADLTELVEGLQELLRWLDLAYPWVGSGSGCRKELGEAIQQSRNHLTELEEAGS